MYKGVKQYHTEPEEWDVQKDMHTPLVARDDYEELQESREEIHKVMKKRQSRYTKDRQNIRIVFREWFAVESVGTLCISDDIPIIIQPMKNGKRLLLWE